MALLTDEEKREIRARAEVIVGNNENLKCKEIELQAALKIIEKLLGVDWYRKACENKSKLPTNPPPDYDFNKSRIGPIAALLQEHPFGKEKLIHFAKCLKELWGNNTNSEQKIKKYSTLRERNGNISFEHFKRLAFELQIAAYFKRKGLGIYFISEQKGKKTPEFRLSSAQGTTYVECKKKDTYVKLEREISNICHYIGEQVLKKMADLQVNYSIDITFEKEINHSDITPVLTLIHHSMEKQQKCFKERISDITIEGQKLKGLRVTESPRDIPKLPEESTTIQFASETFQGLDSDHIDYDKMAKIRARETDIPIFNHRQVVIYSPFMATKAKSILHSIKEAGNQLLESSGYV